MQQKDNSGLGLGIACTQRINSGRWSNAYIACDWQSRQYGNGLESRMPGLKCSRQELWQIAKL